MGSPLFATEQTTQLIGRMRETSPARVARPQGGGAPIAEVGPSTCEPIRTGTPRFVELGPPLSRRRNAGRGQSPAAEQRGSGLRPVPPVGR